MKFRETEKFLIMLRNMGVKKFANGEFAVELQDLPPIVFDKSVPEKTPEEKAKELEEMLFRSA